MPRGGLPATKIFETAGFFPLRGPQRGVFCGGCATPGLFFFGDKQKGGLLKKPLLCRGGPGGASFCGKFQYAISSPGSARLLGRIGNLAAGKTPYRSRSANNFVCAPSNPPRRGFRGSAEPRCLTPALRAGAAPSSTLSSPNRQSAQELPSLCSEASLLCRFDFGSVLPGA